MLNLHLLVVGIITHLFLLVSRIYVDQVVIIKVTIVCEGQDNELV